MTPYNFCIENCNEKIGGIEEIEPMDLEVSTESWLQIDDHQGSNKAI